MNKYLATKQIRRFFEIMTQEMELEESTTMEVADLYEPWTPEKNYPVGKILKYGVNEDNETQLYKVQQQHVSQSNWLPSQELALYKPIGFDNGVPIWTQPLGGHDAYAIGDRVKHNGQIWKSIIAGNIWEPGVVIPGVDTWVLDN